MAPVNQRASFKGKKVKNYSEKGQPSAVTQKTKKWSPGNKYFDGSLQQGQGFAFKRKQNIQQEYSKLLRKEKWRMRGSKTHVTEEYPEHLRHLYIAEQQKLDEEAQMNRIRRKKGRTAEPDEEETGTRELDVAGSSSATQAAACSETSTLSGSSNKQDSQSRSHKDQRQRNQKKISSYQKMKQDYERIKEERERKRQEYLKDKAQRDEALKKYKEKKMATYQLLKKKTKKGQPNLNLQMELLLQKIQAQRR